MGLRVIIDIFSGRPNPVLELEQRESRRAMQLLRSASLKDGEAPPRLGFRGFIVETDEKKAQVRRFRALAPAHQPASGATRVQRVQDFVLNELIIEARLGAALAQIVRDEIIRATEAGAIARRRRHHRPVRAHPCHCAPLYEPAWWNDGGQRQFGNNCYNYATNYRTDTFAQPGLAAGAMYSALTRASVRPAAEKDDLISDPGANNRCPKEGHLVALVIWPGVDFHWYRKGRDGHWTHKPGGTHATNVDNSGNTILDPRTADRGGYTDFCTFMVVMHGHVKIR